MDDIVLMEARKHGIGIVLSGSTDRVGSLVTWMGRVYVVIDINATPAEQRCTAMHEIAHHVLGHPIPRNDTEYEALEIAADRWAAKRLIPDDLLADALERARDRRELAEILMVDPKTLDARHRPAREQQSSSCLFLVPQVV